MAGERLAPNLLVLLISVVFIFILALVNFKIIDYSGMKGGKNRLGELYNKQKLAEEQERALNLQKEEFANNSRLADIIQEKEIIKWGKLPEVPVLLPQHLDEHSAPFVVAKQMNFTEGTFVECGMLLGRFMSNTIALEVTYKWNGLLVVLPTTGPEIFQRKINRNAWVAEVCLSKTKFFVEKKATIEKEVVVPYDVYGKSKNITTINVTTVQCYPLASLIIAKNLTTVDYLSLDGLSNQLEILETIPFNFIQIKMISVQINNYGGGDAKETENEENVYHEFMLANGFIYYQEIVGVEPFFKDVLYFHKTLTMQKGVPYKEIPNFDPVW